MRILYISNSTSVSGAPAVLLSVVKEMAVRHEVGVVMPDSDGPLFSMLSGLGVRCWCGVPYGLTIWPRVLNPFKYLKRLYGLTYGRRKVSTYIGNIIDEFKPDIVHTNVGPLDLALDECRKRNIPHVWHLREFQNGMRFWPSRRSFMDKVHSKDNFNIAITRCVFDYWRLRDCDAVIYDGVNADDAVLSRNEAKEPFFISVGRVEKNKGQMELLKSYLRYRRKGGDAGLKIVGRMSMFYGLRCRAFVMMHGLGSYVDFEGHRNDVRELMRKALALVVTSVTEGFCLVSAEAMLQGCIVIGHDVTGMKEQFDIGRDFTGEEIGLRYKGVLGLSDAMSDVSERPGDFVSMRECARRTVMAKYDLREMADGLERYYLKITEGKS